MNRTSHQAWYMNQPTRTLSFTSGKGGVGKTTLVTNIATQLAAEGKKVLILDGDLGMANVDVMFGVKTTRSLYDVISGKHDLKEVIVEAAPNISVIPGGSGIYELCHISAYEKQALLSEVEKLEENYDFMLIDTAPGIDENVLYLNSAAQEINIILTPDPSSMTDAYALIKMLNQRKREEKFSVICNQVRNEAEAERLFQRLFDVASKFLYVSLEYRGFVPADANLRAATQRNQIISQVNRRAVSSVSFRDICKSFIGPEPHNEVKGGLQFFWNQFVSVA